MSVCVYADLWAHDNDCMKQLLYKPLNKQLRTELSAVKS